MATDLRVILVAMVLSTTGPAAAAQPEAKTPEAVIAADEAWGTAETAGDADFVNRLLLPDYRSVGARGETTRKAAIVARVRQRGPSPSAKAEADAWRVSHPMRGEVTISGDTAILRWTSTATATADAVSSCDVFVYRDGEWHAIYSQHASL